MAESQNRKQRVSLTKKQLEEDPSAVELLELLQTVTSDGRVLEADIQEIQKWLTDHRGSSLPAIQHLIRSVDTVLEDGRVTEEEFAWLHKCIETILPKEERDIAALRRREAVASDREQAKAEKEHALAQKAARAPIARFDFMVAGVTASGCRNIVLQYVKPEDKIFLARDLANQYSQNAIAIRLSNGWQIGYVPEYDASRLAPLLDQGALQLATVKKVLVNRAAIPVVWGELYQPDAPIPEAVSLSNIPPAINIPTSAMQLPPPGTDSTPSTKAARAAVIGLLVVAGFFGLLMLLIYLLR